MPLISEPHKLSPYEWEVISYVMCPCGRTAEEAATRAEAIQKARDMGWTVTEDEAGNVKVDCIHRR